LVFCEHYFITQTPIALEWGWVGVDIFFVLSGFLITGILIDTVDAPHRFRNFYVRRTLRIFPLYYGVLGVVLLATPLFHWEWSKLWLLWPTYLGNYGPALSVLHAGDMDAINYLVSRSGGFALHFIHFWSLCVEEQFYLVWPLVVYTVRDRRRLRNICLAVIFLLPLFRIAARFYLPQALITTSILQRAAPFRLDGFLIGGLVAILFRGPHGQRIRQMGGKLLAISIAGLLVVWGVAVFLLHQTPSSGGNTPWISTVGYSLVDVIAASVLLLALRPGNMFYRVFSLRPLRELGKVSYGFYVFHEIPIELYERLGRRLVGHHVGHVGLIVGPLAFACTTALAFLSFRYLEKPFLVLKDRFTK
jgi:peptidoglycan/LPS O-acetylase OafA/YrhL